MHRLGLAAPLLMVFCLGASAHAAELNVVAGQLVGASNVNVGGTLYDVEFLDGTCIDLYSGCDDPTDFTFNTIEDALLAAQALLDQVLVDGSEGAFDTEPDLTNGVVDAAVGLLITPYTRLDDLLVLVVATTNVVPDADSAATGSSGRRPRPHL